MYRITITKFEPNPKYEPKGLFYGGGPQEPAELESKSLETVLTDEEFKIIKKSVLEVI